MINLLFLLFLASTSFALTPDEISDLAAQTMNSDPNLRTASRIVEDAGGRLALYGGDSRELVSFVVRKSAQLGGTEAYKKWLSSQEFFSTLDWHRVGSDMDLFIMPPTNQPPDAALLTKLEEAGATVQKELPTGIFFKSLDFHVSTEFFEQFDPMREHREPISNIIISSRGIEHPPELNVQVDGVTRNLAQWGTEQLASGKLDFRLTRDSSGNLVGDTYGKLRQALRFVRYLAENPDMTATPQTIETINTLVTDLQEHHLEEIKRILAGGDQDRFATNTLDAIRKVQEDSRDSLTSRVLLDKFGFTKLLTDAGVAKEYLYDPLPNRTGPIPAGAKTVGEKGIVVYHRTTLAAAQNMSGGALYVSNGKSAFANKESANFFGLSNVNALFASTKTGELSFGNFYVPIPVSPDAVYGVDVDKKGDDWIIKTRQGIAQRPDGTLDIDPINRTSLLRSLLDSIPGASPEEARSVFQALGKIVTPELGGREVELFKKIATLAAKNKAGVYFLRSYLDKPGTVEFLKLNSSAPVRDAVEQAVKANPIGVTKAYLAANPELAATVVESSFEQIAQDPNTMSLYLSTGHPRPQLVERINGFYASHPDILPAEEFIDMTKPGYQISEKTATEILSNPRLDTAHYAGLLGTSRSNAMLFARVAVATKHTSNMTFQSVFLKNPTVKKAVIENLLQMDPASLGHCPPCFPLPSAQDKLLRQLLLSGKVQNLGLSQLGTFARAGYEISNPQVDSLGFLANDTADYSRLRGMLLKNGPHFQQYIKSLPPKDVPTGVRLQVYNAAPKEMASLIDEATLKEVTEKPNYYGDQLEAFNKNVAQDAKLAAIMTKIKPKGIGDPLCAQRALQGL